MLTQTTIFIILFSLTGISPFGPLDVTTGRTFSSVHANIINGIIIINNLIVFANQVSQDHEDEQVLPDVRFHLLQ